MTEDSVFEMPTASAVDRLVRWHTASADSDGRLALSLAAEGLDEAAEKNRRRSAAHRQTAQFLTILKLKVCTPEREFRGHLEMKNRPRAKVRAPP